MTFTCAYLGHQ